MSLGGFYTSMAGLETSRERLDTAAQNLANANTDGYAAAQTAAVALPYNGQVPLPGADVISVGDHADRSNGPLTRTGAPLDVAVKSGWLVVQGPSGKPALTRNGHLFQNAEGILTTGTGEPVLNTEGNPISLPPLKTITISSTGQISGIATSSASEQPQTYGQLFIAAAPAGGLTPMGDTLYRLPRGATPTPAANATVVQGYLSGSNVNSVKTMMDLISVSRGFKFETQVMTDTAKTGSELDQIMTA